MTRRKKYIGSKQTRKKIIVNIDENLINVNNRSKPEIKHVDVIFQ